MMRIYVQYAMRILQIADLFLVITVLNIWSNIGSCKKCVEIHLLSNTRCPFCNETIQTTAPFEELETAPSRHQNPKS